MQLIPVTQLSVLPFASIRPKFNDEHPLFFERRLKVSLAEIEKAAHEAFKSYSIDSDDAGLFETHYFPEANVVCVTLLQRIPNLAGVLDLTNPVDGI